MNKNLNQLIHLVKQDLTLFLSIGFGVFLFVLFFQPFPLERFDFNNRMLFFAGLGAIVFVFMVLIRVVFPWLIRKYEHSTREITFYSFLSGLAMMLLSSVSFAFYLYYVGSVEISFFNMFKVVLICTAPPLALRLYDANIALKIRNEALVEEKETMLKQMEAYEDTELDKTITFVSESSTENLNLPAASVVFIQSADNYVEIVYREADQFKKKLIRNTLKNVEHQLKPYTGFIRCHRMFIVNTYHIEKLNKNFNTHWLSIKGYQNKIPVSRQYLLKFKEAQ